MTPDEIDNAPAVELDWWLAIHAAEEKARATVQQRAARQSRGTGVRHG